MWKDIFQVGSSRYWNFRSIQMRHWALTNFANSKDVTFVRRGSKTVEKYCVHRAVMAALIELTQTRPCD